ncbi:phytanoyl-CoA dioxygenase family protein [Rhodopirellula sp. JC740]|uniref:Phytanoyl-CoA dioxygenase family protein n=1 Tax=Rhodopirellula halodulae TaxID=2894198 RepID=A0ABS8NJ71_9BACT|nr:phytanoyl-CoA dioxygenase family protein [Rhodopirellula sp. JC740]MCC9643609.1 phytanoyl-CoA dioxygenase family protein [Rhodopirellula sp. JC740]
MNRGTLERDGFQILRAAVTSEVVSELLQVCSDSLADESASVRARSSRGHVYAARNLIGNLPQVETVWQTGRLLAFLHQHLGQHFGLVRALFFDKPPDRTWALPWHKDTSVAVKDNSLPSDHFSRPTLKAGVPHLIACDEVLKRMLTLRIHLDEVTDENGPLQVIPSSHVSSDTESEDLSSAVAIHAAAGDVLAMRPLLSHSSGSSVSGTRRHRRILHLEFAESARLPDGVEWHDFVKPIAISNRSHASSPES